MGEGDLCTGGLRFGSHAAETPKQRFGIEMSQYATRQLGLGFGFGGLYIKAVQSGCMKTTTFKLSTLSAVPVFTPPTSLLHTRRSRPVVRFVRRLDGPSRFCPLLHAVLQRFRALTVGSAICRSPVVCNRPAFAIF